jgi:hypothetical protein
MMNPSEWCPRQPLRTNYGGDDTALATYARELGEAINPAGPVAPTAPIAIAP